MVTTIKIPEIQLPDPRGQLLELELSQSEAKDTAAYCSGHKLALKEIIPLLQDSRWLSEFVKEHMVTEYN